MSELTVPKIGEPISEVEELSEDYYTKEVCIEEGMLSFHNF